MKIDAAPRRTDGSSFFKKPSVATARLETHETGTPSRHLTAVTAIRPSETTPASPSASAPRHLTFHGQGGTLFGIHIVNMFFTLVTGGLYYFWAKTRTRQFIFSQTEFEGDRFAYHGTGRELLIGALKALVVFGVPVIVLRLVHDVLHVHEAIKLVAGALSSAVAFAFVPVAIVGARRYRLSRTSWRGIRFSFRGRTWPLMKIFLNGTMLTIVTFGVYYPYFLVRRQQFLVSQSYFGNEHFEFSASGRELIEPFVRAVLLTPFTLGLSWFWWAARRRRYVWEHTRFGGARFRSSVTGGALLALHAGNAALLVCSLGLAWSWVKLRNIHFAYRTLSMLGPLDLGRIQQEAYLTSATGEALAGFFDSGFDLA